jgi:hypothetical protein
MDIPEIKPREELEHLVLDGPSGYLESDYDWIMNNLDAVIWFLENRDQLATKKNSFHALLRDPNDEKYVTLLAVEGEGDQDAFQKDFEECHEEVREELPEEWQYDDIFNKLKKRGWTLDCPGYVSVWA